MTLIQFEDTTTPTDLTGGITAAAFTVANDTSTEADLDNVNIILLDGAGGGYATVGDAVDAMEDGGSFSLKHQSNLAEDDAFLFAYENSTTGLVTIAIANVTGADDNSGTSATFVDGTLNGEDLATLTGITDVTSLAAADFNFIT